MTTAFKVADESLELLPELSEELLSEVSAGWYYRPGGLPHQPTILFYKTTPSLPEV